MSHLTASARAFEPRDASPRVIGVTALVLVAGVLGSLAVAAWILAADRPADSQSAVPDPAGRFEYGPRAHPDVRDDWTAALRESQEHLTGYRWLDRSAGVVQLPIERAMDLLATEDRVRRGLPPDREEGR